MIMIARLLQLAVIGAVLTGLAGAQSVFAEGWSLWPSAQQKSNQSTAKSEPIAPPHKAQPEPSALEKIGTGTKNFFTQIGNTLTGKKPEEPRKRMAGMATPSRPYSAGKKESGSWMPSWLQAEEQKPTTVPEYMRTTTRPDLLKDESNN